MASIRACDVREGDWDPLEQREKQASHPATQPPSLLDGIAGAKAKEGKAGQGRAGQGCARQGKARQRKQGQASAGKRINFGVLCTSTVLDRESRGLASPPLSIWQPPATSQAANHTSLHSMRQPPPCHLLRDSAKECRFYANNPSPVSLQSRCIYSLRRRGGRCICLRSGHDGDNINPISIRIPLFTGLEARSGTTAPSKAQALDHG